MTLPQHIPQLQRTPAHLRRANVQRIRHKLAQQAKEAATLYGHEAAEALAETLWLTRCAVCDTPGEVLCASCQRNLAFIDYWRACSCCGAPMGRTQCTECNDVMLKATGHTQVPFVAAANAVAFDEAAARIVRTWKDLGERRLVHAMAAIMTPYVAPAWRAQRPLVVAIPASQAAVRNRGFDHGLELATEVASQLHLPAKPLFARPTSKDQRALNRARRLKNMHQRMALLPNTPPPACVLLVDDVCTTGATLFAAADALSAAGCRHIYALTFARVW